MKKVLLLHFESYLPLSLVQVIDELSTEEISILSVSTLDGSFVDRGSNPTNQFLEAIKTIDAFVLVVSKDDNLSQASRLFDVFAIKSPILVISLLEDHEAEFIALGAQEALLLTELSSTSFRRGLHRAIARHEYWSRQVIDSERLRDLVEIDDAGWIVVDPQGYVLFANPIALSLLGQNVEELVGQNFGVPSDFGVMEIEIVRQTDHGPQLAILDVQVMEVEWNGQTAFLELLKDVTDFKKQIRESRAAVRQRDQFLATLSHELRNPLSALTSGLALMASRGFDPSSLSSVLDLMNRQCQSMARLLDDLLDFSRIGRGKISFSQQPVQLREIVEESIATVQQRILAKKQKLHIDFQACDSFCMADRDRLKQVIVNLLTNANKYSPNDHEIFVTLQVSHKVLVLEIRDTGDGIPESMLENIFEPFVQLRDRQVKTDDGLGIGLALARRLTELHGGTLVANSEGLGKGSTFTLRLPLLSESKLPGPSSLDSLDPRAESAVEPFSRLRVVIVEDRDEVRWMTSALVKSVGHEVCEASDGQEGFELIEKTRPDLALIDLGLPGLTGHVIVQKLRQIEDCRELYLVALSGQGEIKDRQMAAQSGFDIHLTKPVTLKMLEMVFKEAAERQAKKLLGKME